MNNEDDHDHIKPIETESGQKNNKPNPVPEPNLVPEPNPAPPIDGSLPGGANPAPEAPPEDAKPFLTEDDWDDDNTLPPKDGSAFFEKNKQPLYEDENTNFIKKGEQLDLLEKDPTLKSITVGAGWAQKSFEKEPVDIDLSIFLLDKTDMTRIDEDFIFYNNDNACEGAVQHLMDSRTGAGEGDDENVFIDLNGLPFDILKIIFVFSIYDPEIKGLHFGMVKNMFFSIVNKYDGREIARYLLDPEDHKGGNAMIVTTLIREGPRWIMEASADISNAGLAKIATDHGIIVKELQTTGDDIVGENTTPPDKD